MTGLALPERKIIALIVGLSLVSPMHYALNFLYPPEGAEFIGYPDDVLMLTIMGSPLMGFVDPWSFDGGKVWHNPLIGSTYLFLILGVAPAVLSLNMYAAFIFFKFVFSLAYYMVAYNFLLCFLNKKRASKAFVVFSLVTGVGGIIYVLSSLIFGGEYLPAIGYAFTREFDELAATAHSLTHVFRLYYMIPEAAGMLSVIYNIKNNARLSGIFLFISFLFYPMYGIVFSAVNFLFILSKNYQGRLSDILVSIRRSLPILLFAIPALLLWLLPSMQRPYYFESSRLVYESTPTAGIFISLFFMFAFSAYFLRKKYPGLFAICKTVPFLFFMVLFSLENLFPLTAASDIFHKWTVANHVYGAMELLNNFSVFIEVAVICLSALYVKKILDSKMDYAHKFLAVWVVAAVVIAGIDPGHIFNVLNTLRFAPALIFPLAVLAFLGVEEFSRRRIKIGLVITVLVLLSLPSLAGYNIWLQRSARDTGLGAFATHDEAQALNFLRNQSHGIVLSDRTLGPFIPYYTGKNALLFSGRPYPGLLRDVNEAHDIFFSQDATVEERDGVIRKYGIKYVLLRNNETLLEMPGNTIMIRNGQAQIYEIQ